MTLRNALKLKEAVLLHVCDEQDIPGRELEHTDIITDRVELGRTRFAGECNNCSTTAICQWCDSDNATQNVSTEFGRFDFVPCSIHIAFTWEWPSFQFADKLCMLCVSIRFIQFHFYTELRVMEINLNSTHWRLAWSVDCRRLCQHVAMWRAKNRRSVCVCRRANASKNHFHIFLIIYFIYFLCPRFQGHFFLCVLLSVDQKWNS